MANATTKKSRKKAPKKSSAAKKKTSTRGPGRPSMRGYGPMNIWIADELRAELDARADDAGRSRRAQLERDLRDYYDMSKSTKRSK